MLLLCRENDLSAMAERVVGSGVFVTVLRLNAGVPEGLRCLSDKPRDDG